MLNLLGELNRPGGGGWTRPFMTDTGWHRADIIAAVHKRNTTLTKLSRDAGLADATMRSALHKPHPSANRYLAKFLGVPPHVLWPRWFDEHGLRRCRPYRARKRRRPSSQKRKAA